MPNAQTADEARALERVPKRLYIQGRWRDAALGKTFPLEDPSTGRVLCEVSDASPEDGLAALEAAHAARARWASASPLERRDVLARAHAHILGRLDELALLMTLEMGKPVAQSRGEILYAAEYIRWFSEEALRLDGTSVPSPDGKGRMLTLLQPIGTCLLITPWNFPMALAARKIAPALAAGNTVVIKPADLAPLSTHALVQAFEQAGLPPGVLNLVSSARAGALVEPLLRDGRLGKLSFTGSTAVGKLLMRQSADRLLRLSLELGGNAPLLVFDDVDLDATVEQVLHAKLRNMGQACTAANRVYVSARIAPQLTEKLVARMSGLKVSRGTEPGAEVGPLIDEKSRDKVHRLVADAVSRGAKVLLGGRPLPGPGHFYAPTVLTDIQPGSSLLTEEIFGPVLPLIPFQTEEEAFSQANATEYGLVAYVFTQSLPRALRAMERLEAGMVGVNQGLVSEPSAPFGGIKQSGFGREGGSEGIHEYLNLKYVAVRS